MAGSLYATKLDPLGIATWLPRPGDVTSVSLGLQSRQDFTTEDPEQIRDLIRIHALALENPVTVHPDYDGTYRTTASLEEKAVRFTLTYTLPNGWVVRMSACPTLDKQENSTEFGIEPDLKIDITSDDWNNGRDTMIETAKKIILEYYEKKEEQQE
jgi:hypothetical protein